jgi:hypothetical protein
VFFWRARLSAGAGALPWVPPGLLRWEPRGPLGSAVNSGCRGDSCLWAVPLAALACGPAPAGLLRRLGRLVDRLTLGIVGRVPSPVGEGLP